MSKETPKSINRLMKHLRDKKGIDISGSSQKIKLLNIGYYHGYKGYRYIRKESNTVKYGNFNELVAVYDFDSQLKQLFYPYMMKIETAFKNRVLSVITIAANSSEWIDIYNKLLNNYSFQKDDNSKKKELQQRLNLRNKINQEQSKAYNNGKPIAVHYLSKSNNMPIWGIFELIDLGTFGSFLARLNPNCKIMISKTIGFSPKYDGNGELTEKFIFSDKDLRNAIAHDDVVFDTRFRKGHVDKQIKKCLTNEMSITNLDFDYVTDYFILVIYQLKLIGTPKNELKKIVNQYVDLTEKLRKAIPFKIFDEIIATDNKNKIEQLKKYIAK